MAKKKTTSGTKLSKGQWVAIIIATIPVIGGILTALITILIPYFLEHLLISPITTSPASSSLPSSCSFTSQTRYGFDCGISGWDKTSFYQNQAIENVTVTQFSSKDGIPSQVLALTIDFTGTIDERKNQYRESGEVQVDLNGFPPTGYSAQSVDLHEITIVAWIWASKGSIGDPTHRNGIQLFLRDSKDKNCYGMWNNITQEEVWFRVSWQENSAALCDPGFESSNPKLLGVKIALGTNSIQTYASPLTIYVDDVDWQVP